MYEAAFVTCPPKSFRHSANHVTITRRRSYRNRRRLYVGLSPFSTLPSPPYSGGGGGGIKMRWVASRSVLGTVFTRLGG